MPGVQSPSLSVAGGKRESSVYSKAVFCQEPLSRVQGRGPISKVGVFPFLLLDREKWKKPALPWPLASLELILLPLAGSDMQTTNAGHSSVRVLSSAPQLGHQTRVTHPGKDP